MIGTDIIEKERIAKLWQKHQLHFAKKVLHREELSQLENHKNPIRFLAMRWAAKEAFSKALRTGLRPPVLMPAFWVSKDCYGAPFFKFSKELEHYLETKKVHHVHLSLSDERHYAIAMVMLEIKH